MPEIVETLAAAGAPRRRAALRAGVGAAVARHLRHLLRRAAGRRDRGVASPRLYADAYAREPFVRFVRERLPEVAAVAGSNYAEVGFTLGAPPRRRDSARWRRQRDRQPDQGRRRPGDPEHEPDARPGRDGVAGGSRTVAVASRRPVRSTRSSSWAARCSRERRWRTRRAEIARVARRARALLVVHGGGPQATALAKRLGIEPQHRRRPARHRRRRRSTS